MLLKDAKGSSCKAQVSLIYLDSNNEVFGKQLHFLSLSDVTPPITWTEDSCQRILERVFSENWGCAIHSAQQDCNQQTRHGSECSWQLCRQKGVTFEAQISWHHLWVESQLRGFQQGSSFNGFSPVHHFVDMQPEPDSTLLGWILRFGSTNIPDDDLTSCSPSISRALRSGLHPTGFQYVMGPCCIRIALDKGNELQTACNFYCGMKMCTVYKCGGNPCVNWIAWNACLLLQYAQKNMCKCECSDPADDFWKPEWMMGCEPRCFQLVSRRGRIRMLLARLAKQADVILWVLQKNACDAPQCPETCRPRTCRKRPIGANRTGLEMTVTGYDTCIQYTVFQCSLVCHKVYHPSRAIVLIGHVIGCRPWSQLELLRSRWGLAQAKPEQLCSQLMVSCKSGKDANTVSTPCVQISD